MQRVGSGLDRWGEQNGGHPGGVCVLQGEPGAMGGPGSSAGERRVRAPPQEGFSQFLSVPPLWHCLGLHVAAGPAPRATPVWLRLPPLTGSLGLKWCLYLQPPGQPFILSQLPKRPFSKRPSKCHALSRLCA